VIALLMLLLVGPAAFGQYEDPYPNYTGNNLLLEGSSFEVGRDNIGFARKLFFQHHQNDGFLFLPIDYDERPDYVAHGVRSLKIVNETEDHVYVDYHWLPLEPSSGYKVSFWAKAEKSAGEPPDKDMSITVKVIGKPSQADVSSTVHQETFSLTEALSPYVSEAFSIDPDTMERDLVYLQFWTGPWKSAVDEESNLRLHGTIWLDGVQFARSAYTAYEFPDDEEVEIGVWAEDRDGPRTGHLFHDGENYIAAGIRLFSETFTSDLDIDYSVHDSYGDIIATGTEHGVSMASGSADASFLIRRISPTPRSFSIGKKLAQGQKLLKSIDLLDGKKGIFKVELSARESGGGAELGTEELLLCVIEPDETGPDATSPFGTHTSFLNESHLKGFNWPSEPHDHVEVTSRPQEYIYAAIADGGFKWVRDFSFASWAAVQPTQTDWIFNDHLLDLCEAHGLELFPILGWVCPEWADAGPSIEDPFVSWQYPRNLVYTTAWRDFVFTIADHYQDRIGVWEICNEPYFYYSVSDYYDTFLVPARQAIDLVAPNRPT